MSMKYISNHALPTFIALCVWAGASAQTAASNGTNPASDCRNLVRTEKAEKPAGERKIRTGANELQLAQPRPHTGAGTGAQGTTQAPTTVNRRKKQ